MLLHIDIEDKVHYTDSFVKKNRFGINGETIVRKLKKSKNRNEGADPNKVQRTITNDDSQDG